MANDVYRHTHAALSALVSPRVASSLLEEALQAQGFDSSTVTVRGMRHALAGRVRRELAASFPRAWLTKTLKGIADELEALPPPSALTPNPVTRALLAEQDAEKALKVLTSERLVAVPLAPPAAAVAGEPAGVAHAPRRARPSRLEDAAVTHAFKLFGDIETVRQVVVVRGQAVRMHRGQGIDEGKLPSLVLSSRHLLARSGELRTLSVEHGGGALFLFPFGEDSLVVVTLPNANIGAVLNARAALEEAA